MLALKQGADIDGFTIGDRVHSGAMGNIYRVTKTGYAKPLIMKVPRVGPDEPSEGIISFETEATIVPTLKGEHVPPFIAVGDLARLGKERVAMPLDEAGIDLAADERRMRAQRLEQRGIGRDADHLGLAHQRRHAPQRRCWLPAAAAIDRMRSGLRESDHQPIP